MATYAPCGSEFNFAIRVNANYLWEACYIARIEFPDAVATKAKEVI